MGADNMRKYDVPQAAWAAFGIADIPGTPGPACAVPFKDVTMLRPVTPEYPDAARAMHLGPVVVIITITVTAKAEVAGASIVQTSGTPIIDMAALLAARQSTYSPKIANCSPVAGTYMFRANFN